MPSKTTAPCRADCVDKKRTAAKGIKQKVKRIGVFSLNA
jgi:hypothetical protein